AGQRADSADELGVRQDDPADQARPRASPGEARRGRQGRWLLGHSHDQQHPDQHPGSRGDAGSARGSRHHDEDQAGRLRHAARGREQQELRPDQLPVERAAGSRRQHVPVLQDDAGHVAQLVRDLERADRRLARQDARGLEPGRQEEALQRPDEDPPGRAADDLHHPSDRAEGVQPESPGLRADSRRDDALQGCVAEVARLVLRRLGATIPVLVIVTSGVFLLLHLTPGDPIDVMMAESADATVKENLRRELGLDRPLAVQYVRWMGRLLRGDLGRSIRNGEPVIENVSRRLRPSLELAALAMTVSLVIAFPLGIVCAVRRNTPIDRAGATFAVFGICMPNFLLALLLIFFFGVTLRWLPISGYTDPLEEGWNGLRSLVLPAVTLGLALAAVVTRTLRSSVLEALAEHYVRTARAKGLSEWRVIQAHVLKNALIPVVTVLGLQLGTLIGGAVITEYVFALPGVGRLVVDAVFARDYPLVQGVVLLIAVGFILSNLLVDLVYGWIDPRIRRY